MRLTNLISGPHEDEDEVWCVFNITDGFNFWSEEVYYDSMEDCLAELDVLRCLGAVEFDEFEDEDEPLELEW